MSETLSLELASSSLRRGSTKGMVDAVKKVGLVPYRLSLVMRTHTRTMIIPWKILRI